MMDQTTPEGKVPSDDPFSKGISALKHLVSR
jgi:hypothetical protein